MNKLKMLKRKWIDGECRHFCFLCPYWNRFCQHDYGCATKYGKGYAQGYEDGYNEASKRFENFKNLDNK